MSFLITIFSVVLIMGVVRFTNRFLPFRICPICAGVAGTWIWMLGAKVLGYPIDAILLAMLMGGSVVGVAYQLEKRLPAGKSPLLWKALFIPVGFVVAYSLVVSQWVMLAVSLGIAGVIAWAFIIGVPKQHASQKVEEHVLSEVEGLKKKMENCC